MEQGQSERPYRILALDGGGLDGLFTFLMLDRIQKRLPGFLDGVELFAGTSAGSINALMLAAHHGELDSKWRRFEQFWTYETLFQASPYEIWLYMTGWYPLFGQSYTQTLKDLFEDKTLGQLSVDVVLGTFDTLGRTVNPRRWAPTVLTRAQADLPLWQAASYSSALPGLRPMRDGYTDGGWGAPTPELPAVDFALGQKKQPEQLSVLSVGVGAKQQYLSDPNTDWGVLQWWLPWSGNNYAQTNLDFTPDLDGTYGVMNNHMRALLNQSDDLGYFRLNPAVLDVTPLSATVWGGVSTYYRQKIIENLYKAIDDPRTTEQLDAAVQWLQQASWATAPDPDPAKS